MPVATGSRLILGLGRERRWGVPGTEGLEYFTPTLPMAFDLERAEADSGAVNRSGYVEPGVPGVITGSANFADRMTAARLLPFAEHLLGDVTKANPAAGVFTYVMTPDFDAPGAQTSFWGLAAKPPVERRYVYGVRYGKLTLALATPMQARLEGLVSHETTLGAAVPDGGNLGTYVRGPWVRGPLADPTAGDVHLQVSQVAPSLEFKVEQTAGAPTFPGAAVPVYMDPTLAEADWQNGQGATGLDLGIWSENKDPLDLIWPGTAADHGDLSVGDTFVIPASWTDPAYTVLAAARFTAAHLSAFYRPVGDPTWIPVHTLAGELVLENALDPVSGGSSSRYYTSLDRTGLFRPTVKLTRRYADSAWMEAYRRHERLELRLAWEGQQLDAAYREGVVVDFASSRIVSLAAAAADAGPVDQEIELLGETNGAGDPPVTVTITTARDWTPAA